jgi:hypothetical protein
VNLSTQLSTSSEIKIMIYIYFCVILQRRWSFIIMVYMSLYM